jgi:hypothetical protein
LLIRRSFMSCESFSAADYFDLEECVWSNSFMMAEGLSSSFTCLVELRLQL